MVCPAATLLVAKGNFYLLIDGEHGESRIRLKASKTWISMNKN